MPGGNIGGLNDSGWVGMLHALDGGNVATAIHQNSTGVPGSAEAGTGSVPPSRSPSC